MARIPIWTTREQSSSPSSTARRNGVPWAMRSPNISSLMSVWASMCTSPTGPWRARMARRMGSTMVWSPPRATVITSWDSSSVK